MGNISELKKIYKLRRRAIGLRLSEFDKLRDSGHERFFEELCFCLLTPQSKAQSCGQIISDLKKNGLLYKGSRKQLEPFLKRTRFYRNKARYLMFARRVFSKEEIARFKKSLAQDGPLAARQWLIENIKGLGHKESSHFLRNIGYGQDLAILDVHVLRSLKRLGVIDELPKSLSPKKYLQIEEKVRQLASKLKIPASHLDLLFWSIGTGKIYK